MYQEGSKHLPIPPCKVQMLHQAEPGDCPPRLSQRPWEFLISITSFRSESSSSKSELLINCNFLAEILLIESLNPKRIFSSVNNLNARVLQLQDDLHHENENGA